MRIGDIIKRLLVVRGLTQGELADRLATTQNNISRWMGGREPRGQIREKILKLAAESGILPEAPSRERIIPIMGYVGAGAEVDPDYEQVPFDGLEQVELPFIPGEDLVGFWVKGDSQLPKYDDGEVLLVEREQPTSIDRMIGDMAVVRTYGGKRMVKRIMPGPKPNTFNLESHNAKTIVGVRLVWASPIKYVLPNVSRRAIKPTRPKPAKKAGAEKRR